MYSYSQKDTTLTAKKSWGNWDKNNGQLRSQAFCTNELPATFGTNKYHFPNI